MLFIAGIDFTSSPLLFQHLQNRGEELLIAAGSRIMRRVPREMFFPRPNVDSAVVRVEFCEGRIPVKSAAAYRAVVRCAFANRRKTLENNMIRAFRLLREEARALLQAAGIADMTRGEMLSPTELARLADVLTARKILQ